MNKIKPNWYERTLLPYLIDSACSVKAVRYQREKVVPLAHGRVLEIGIGTGLNLRHYHKAKVRSLTGLDPAQEMHKLAHRRSREAGLEVELVGLSAERIPRADASFDTVIVTYTLCTIPDPLAALKEMRRVLTPRRATDLLRTRARAGCRRTTLAGAHHAVVEKAGRWLPSRPRHSGLAERSRLRLPGSEDDVPARAAPAHLQLLGCRLRPQVTHLTGMMPA